MALTATATAAAGNAGSTEVFEEQLEEPLPAAMCPDLPAGLGIKLDESGNVINHAANPNGYAVARAQERMRRIIEAGPRGLGREHALAQNSREREWMRVNGAALIA